MTELEALKIMQGNVADCIIGFRKQIVGEMSEFEKGEFYTLAALEHQLGVAELMLNKQSPNISEILAKIKNANLGVQNGQA